MRYGLGGGVIVGSEQCPSPSLSPADPAGDREEEGHEGLAIPELREGLMSLQYRISEKVFGVVVGRAHGAHETP